MPPRRPFTLSHRLRPALLFALALLLYLPTIGRRDIVTSHEARVAQTARQMAEAWPWEGRRIEVGAVEITDKDRGKRIAQIAGGKFVVNPWLVPVLNGKIRLQKPPLPYWCAAIAFRVAGFGEGAARFVPALLGAASVLLVYALARMLAGRTAAWVAGLVWIGSYFVFDEFRKAMVDPYLAFFTLLAVWAWVRAERSARDNVESESESPKGDLHSSSTFSLSFLFSPLLVFYLALALGVLAKGPFILLHVAVPIALYHWCYRRRRLPGGLAAHGVGLFVFVAVALPWFAYVLLRVPHAWEIWSHETFSPPPEDRDSRPWFFYLANVFQLALPWTPVLITGALIAATRRGRRADATPSNRPRRPRDRRAWFPLLWYGLIVVIFSFSEQRKNAYLLPAMPAQTLIVTQGVIGLLAAVRRSRFRGRPGAVAIAQAVIGVGVAGYVAVILWQGSAGAVPTALSVAAIALALAAAGWPILEMVRWHPRRWAVAQGAGYAVLVALLFSLVLEPKDNDRSAKRVCREVEKLLRSDGGRTLLADRLPDDVGVYLPLDLSKVGNPFATRLLIVRDEGSDVRKRLLGRPTTPYVPNPKAVDGRIVSFRPVPLASAPGDARWKVYEVTVDRSQVAEATRGQ